MYHASNTAAVASNFMLVQSLSSNHVNSYELQWLLIFSSFSTSEVTTLQWNIIVYIIITSHIMLTSGVVSSVSWCIAHMN